VNYLANLSEQQSQFLDAMATQFKFGSDTLTVFLNRFDKANRNQDNSLLAIKIPWSREPEDKAQKFQDELKKICRVLEEEGCPIKKPKRGRQPKGKSPWEEAFKWLWEIKFIEWQQRQEKLIQPITIDALVNQVREKVSADIQKRCGWMRVLEMTHPIGVNDIYTDVNILEKITGRRRLDLAQLLININREKFGLEKTRVPGLAAVEQHCKLMILGKPGAGKTTFLKRIAIQCNSGQFLAGYIPIFITLKDFAEAQQKPSLLQYINDQFFIHDISEQQIVKTLLCQGRMIVLLDGLDEVRETDNDRVLKDIRDFSNQYNANYFVITCRIASKEYTFEHFTEVEVADFEDKQIADFATKWFQTRNREKVEQFIQKLEENQRIKELATNPLLLGLLCLLFEEHTNLSSNRADLYKEWVEILLRRWDGTRGIKRDPVETELNKKDLLSRIALKTFETQNYFFKENQVVKYISDYIQKLPDAKTDPEEVSKAVLKSIEAHHGLLVERARGIYSFCHLSFHEFFTARNIALSHNPPQALQQLVSHITDKRWREVFLLTVGILENADNLLLLMKQQIDGLLGTDEKLQEFLTWVDLKSSSVEAPYKRSAIRAFYYALALVRDRDPYFDIDLGITQCLRLTVARYRNRDQYLTFALGPYLNLARYLGLDLAQDLAQDLALDLALARDRYRYFDLALDLDYAFALDPSFAPYLDFAIAFEIELALARDEDRDRDLARYLTLARDPKLQHKLQQLNQQLEDVTKENSKTFKHWWQIYAHAWAEQLRSAMIQHRNIGHDWQFSNSHWQLLQQYYDSNMLLVDCLNSECYVSHSVRQEIENTLLLPLKANS
jgi:predicted NACHT family NTPase